MIAAANMKLKRDARILKSKALSSLRRGLTCFNSFDEDGRVTAVLLHLQHSAEMLLKSLLIQEGVEVMDRKSGFSVGTERCLGLAKARCGLTEAEAGVIRTVDKMRDAAQHWIIYLDEGILYLHARALVTVIDDILHRSFDDKLAEHLPVRVLPISTDPPGDIALLVDGECRQIARLLQPGYRKRGEARGRIRALLAMEGHATDDVEVSERDIDRIEKAIRANKPIAEIFPRLQTLQTSIEGEGISVRVHFSKREGPPVRYVGGDDPEAAAAIREVDLRRRYHLSPTDLAEAVGLSVPKCAAVKKHLRIDDDAANRHVWNFGASQPVGYSDAAVRKIKEALPSIDLEAVWTQHRPASRGRRSRGR